MSERPGSNVTVLPLGKEGKLHRDEGALPVAVFERGEDMLMLVVLLAEDPGIGPDPVEPMLLEYTSAHGLVRVRGEARVESPDLITFKVRGAPEILQRREFVRVDVAQPVKLADERGNELSASALDLSGGGMLLTAPVTLEPDQTVRFELLLGAGEPPVEGLARVVRTSLQGHRALVFEELAGSDRQRIIRFLFAVQRHALAKTSQRKGNARRTT